MFNRTITVPKYPDGFAQFRHRAWVRLVYWRKFAPNCFVVEGVVVCYSCITFLGPFLGTLFSRCCLSSLQHNCQNDPLVWSKSLKMCLEVGSELHGETFGAKNESRFNNKQHFKFVFSFFLWEPFRNISYRRSVKGRFGIFRFFEAVSRTVLDRFLVNLGCVFLIFVAVARKSWKQ